jgi:hypothetical protein
MTCHSLVHNFSREQPKTTNELLDIATWHASGEEDVEAAFTLVNEGMAVGSGRVTPIKITIKSKRKGDKDGKKGQKCRPHCLATMARDGDVKEEINDFGEKFVVATEHDFMQHT